MCFTVGILGRSHLCSKPSTSTNGFCNNCLHNMTNLGSVTKTLEILVLFVTRYSDLIFKNETSLERENIYNYPVVNVRLKPLLLEPWDICSK